MINRDTHRFIIRQDASGLDASWLKKWSVKPSDIDCTDMSSEQFADLYQSMRDKVKAATGRIERIPGEKHAIT